MWQMILFGAVVVIAGFLIFYLLKKALKITLFVFCIGAAYVALKYFLGVI
jgi:hypothetical protein